MKREKITMYVIAAFVTDDKLKVDIKPIEVFDGGKMYRINRDTGYRMIKPEEMHKVHTNIIDNIMVTSFFAYSFELKKDEMIEACIKACKDKVLGMKAKAVKMAKALEKISVNEHQLRDGTVAPRAKVLPKVKIS